MSGYILQTGKKGSERLEILNELVNPGFIAFLKQAGLKKEMKVLDVGCGTGILACEIAHDVDQLIGIDISKEQIELARSLAAKNKIENVEFRQMAAHDIGNLDEKFDLIYFRYVLMHVKEAKEIIKIAASLLKEGGLIVCDELFDNETFSCDPPNEGYDLWTRGARYQHQVQGSDSSIGMKLKQLFLNAGLKPVIAYTYAQALLTQRQKKLLRLGFEEAGARIAEIGLFTNEEVSRAIALLRDFEADDRYLAFYNKFIRIAVMSAS